MITRIQSAVFSSRQRRPNSTPFPYTTLFRSGREGRDRRLGLRAIRDELAPVAPVLRPEYELALLGIEIDRKSTRLNSSHGYSSYAVFCLKKKTVKIDKTMKPT